MKFKKLVLTLVLVFLVTVFASAAEPSDYYLSCSFGDNYAVITENSVDDNTEVIQAMGYTEDSFSRLFKKNGLVVFALEKQSRSQIQIKTEKTDFSVQIEDISLLDNDNILRIASQIAPDYTGITTVNGLQYIRTAGTIEAAAGQYDTVQYITVKNGLLYTVNIFTASGTAAPEQEILSSITVTDAARKSDNSFSFIISVIIISVLIIALVAVCIYIITVSIIEFRRGNEQNDVREYVRIKRRKF